MTIRASILAEPKILSLDTILDLLMKEIFNQIMNNSEIQSSKNVASNVAMSLNKNQIELLRCYAELGKR